MSVSGELLCSFELLKPLDSSALKSHIKKGRNKRNSILNSPVSLACLSRFPQADCPASRQMYQRKASNERSHDFGGKALASRKGCYYKAVSLVEVEFGWAILPT